MPGGALRELVDTVLGHLPVGIFGAVLATWLLGQQNDVYFKVGMLTTMGLTAKNAILIVEFARQGEVEHGHDRYQATIEAGRTRLRPILMTSFAFILGVIPLAFATGAGAELREALGVGVFFGMIGVTIFGLIFTPVFYVVTRWLNDKIPHPMENSPAHVDGRTDGGTTA